jgi:hypothetical protein
MYVLTERPFRCYVCDNNCCFACFYLLLNMSQLLTPTKQPIFKYKKIKTVTKTKIQSTNHPKKTKN